MKKGEVLKVAGEETRRAGFSLSLDIKNRQAHQLWCGAHPEQKISAVGAKVHLQVLSQPNTTTSAVQIVYLPFQKFKNPGATRFVNIEALPFFNFDNFLPIFFSGREGLGQWQIERTAPVEGLLP